MQVRVVTAYLKVHLRSQLFKSVLNCSSILYIFVKKQDSSCISAGLRQRDILLRSTQTQPPRQLTHWPTDPLTDWPTDQLTDQLTNWPTDRDRLIKWPTDQLTDWLTDWPTHWPTDWLINWPIERLTVSTYSGIVAWSVNRQTCTARTQFASTVTATLSLTTT